MSKRSGYIIQAYWGPRRQTPAQCSMAFRQMLTGMARIDPSFEDWKFAGVDRFWPIPSDDAELSRLISETVTQDDDGAPEPIYGYRFGAGTRTRSETGLLISVHAGCYAPDKAGFANTAELRTAPLNEQNASLVTLPIFKAALLAIAQAWGATWCAAYPKDIIPLWPMPGSGQPHFRMAWITYLSARFARMVAPPSTAIVDRTAEGGLVMTATRDRFDIANPAHLAAARDIEEALAPVNALPWPPDGVPNRTPEA